MTITEFAKSRNIEPQAVSRYLNRHEELKKQCQKEGKNLLLTDDVLRVLDKKYPIPKPTIIMNGVPEEEHRDALEKLLKAQELIIQLQNELTDQKLLQAENEAHRALLEDRERRAEEDAKEAKEKVAELTAELEKERQKTWWQKLTGK